MNIVMILWVYLTFLKIIKLILIVNVFSALLKYFYKWVTKGNLNLSSYKQNSAILCFINKAKAMVLFSFYLWESNQTCSIFVKIYYQN